MFTMTCGGPVVQLWGPPPYRRRLRLASVDVARHGTSASVIFHHSLQVSSVPPASMHSQNISVSLPSSTFPFSSRG